MASAKCRSKLLRSARLGSHPCCCTCRLAVPLSPGCRCCSVPALQIESVSLMLGPGDMGLASAALPPSCPLAPRLASNLSLTAPLVPHCACSLFRPPHAAARHARQVVSLLPGSECTVTLEAMVEAPAQAACFGTARIPPACRSPHIAQLQWHMPSRL